jgi:xanthine dehydrogenase YagS FAD-binding subunit
MVEAGDHRYHAIFETGEARFVSPSSLAPVLIALYATAELVSQRGTRSLPVADLFTVPTSSSPVEHTIEDDELLTRIRVPLDRRVVSATYEVRHRQTLDWPLATASVAWRERRGRISAPRLVLGHVASVPWQVESAAALLDGGEIAGIGKDSVARVADQAVAESRPLPRNGYKVQLARTATRRAVLRCLGAETALEAGAAAGKGAA